MDKYYTPDISEFHVGMTLYRKRKTVVGEEIKEKMDKFVVEDIMCGWDIPSFQKNIENGNFKLKYLDIDDVESLGYGFVTKLWGFESSDGNIIIEVENINDLQKGTIDIYCVQDLRFKGKIKTKAELAKILKQLDI